MHRALQTRRIFLPAQTAVVTAQDLIRTVYLDIQVIDLFNLSYSFLKRTTTTGDAREKALLALSLQRVRKGIRLMGSVIITLFLAILQNFPFFHDQILL